jgi:hypothetical protein
MNEGRNHVLVRGVDSETHPVLERAWSNEEVQPS